MSSMEINRVLEQIRTHVQRRHLQRRSPQRGLDLLTVGGGHARDMDIANRDKI